MSQRGAGPATSLEAIATDPLTHGAPSGWDDFVIAQGLLPDWHSGLLAAVDWCAPAPSSLVLVRDRAGAPVAAFHARHPGQNNPRRFATPGRTVGIGATVCVNPPFNDTGAAFADGVDDRDRTEAVRVFERAVRQRSRPVIAYRGLYREDLAVVPNARRVTFRLYPRMVLGNEWPDRDTYLRSLTRKWRYHLRKLRRAMDADPDLTVAWEHHLDPEQACWLAEVVRARHTSRWLPEPPLPVRYFQQLAGLPGSRFLTYRDGDGRLLAYTAVHDDGRDLLAVCWGSRASTDGRRANLYFDQYLRMVELMVDTGRERLVLGRAWEQIKQRYGAVAQPRWGMVGLA